MGESRLNPIRAAQPAGDYPADQMQDYDDFLDQRAQVATRDGFEPDWMPGNATSGGPELFGFQRALARWAVRQGRAAVFADCGLGKTAVQLTWAHNVVRRANRPVLLLTPLAVAAQTLGEAARFGVPAVRSFGGAPSGPACVVVANYDRLHLFDPADFAGLVCDESSILKSFDGVRRGQITAFARKLPYRLLCTATAAPNDYTELGTSSEALGHLGYMDMLNRFFRNDLNNSSTGRGYQGAANTWRFKGHAEDPFWRWVCSWARAVRRPSDLTDEYGAPFDDGRFTLPPLVEREHVVETRTLAPGTLFALPAADLREQRAERRRTLEERCERVAALVAHDRPALVWAHLNDEADLIERLVGGASGGAVQVKGADSDGDKEERLAGFARGDFRVLVTKPQIGAWGLNYQHCAHVVLFPSHSYEQHYQAVRRCWRFGQTQPVTVDIVTTEGEAGVLKNLQRKGTNAARMFDRLVAHMNDALAVERSLTYDAPIGLPTWL